MTTWLTAREAAAYVNKVRALLSDDVAHFTERGIRNWVNRGQLSYRGINSDRLQVFSLGDVARAEQATRPRALLMAGTGQP